MLMLVAFGVVEPDPTGETEDPDQLQEWETAAGLLGAGLRVGPLVLGGVGGAERGVIDDVGVEAEPMLLGVREQLFDAAGDRVAEAGERVAGQTQPGLAVSAGAFVDRAQVVELEEGADVADDGAAGAAGMEDWIEVSPEGATTREDPFAAVGAVVGRGEEAGGQELAEEVFELVERPLAHLLEAAPTGGEAGAELREEGCRPRQVYMLVKA